MSMSVCSKEGASLTLLKLLPLDIVLQDLIIGGKKELNTLSYVQYQHFCNLPNTVIATFCPYVETKHYILLQNMSAVAI